MKISDVVALYRNPRVRALIYQLTLISLLVLFGWFILTNTLQNMENRGIKTGFSFLFSEAGFPILYSPFMSYNPAVDSYLRTFYIGLFNTVLVSIIGILLATVVGFIMGLARLSGNWLVARLAAIYIEVFRNIPLLLQIMFWYFAILVPSLPDINNTLTLFNDSLILNKKGLLFPRPIFASDFIIVIISFLVSCLLSFIYYGWARKRQLESGRQLPVLLPILALLMLLPLLSYMLFASPLSYEFPQSEKFGWSGGIALIPELAALLIALSIYTGAFIAENVRGGVLAVSHGQTEASYSLGLSRWQTLRLIVIPQALRVIIPPQTSQYLNLIKNSSLATAVGYPDLVAVFAGTALNQTGKAVEIIFMTMLIYLMLSLSTSALMNWYNKKMAFVEK